MKRILLALARVGFSLPFNVLYLLACLVPKDRTLWLFSAWNGKRFSDNPKYIYKHLISSNSPIRAVWVTRDRKLHDAMRAQNLPVVYALSIEGIVHQLRAGAVVFTHSVDWDYVSAFVGRQVKRIQTWHGMPIKKIGFDDARDRNARLKARLNNLLMPYKNERFDLVVSGSEADKSKYHTAFDVALEKIRVTGYPRNDEIVKSITQPGLATQKRIIYMPTFRGAVGSEFALLQGSGFDYAKADALMRDIGATLYIKLHPVQVFSQADLDAMARCANVKPLFNDGDIYEQIGNYDILITDYSGIYFDFLITGKPIIMAPFDLEEYVSKDRELYYPYNNICPDPPCFTWNEVFARLRQLSTGEAVDPTRYFRLQKQFHQFLDDRSSERVVNEIKHLVGIEG